MKFWKPAALTLALAAAYPGVALAQSNADLLKEMGLSASLALAQRTPLLVYTALETDQLKMFKDSIEANVKDVEVR